MTRNWEMRLHFHSGPEFVTARNVVNVSGFEFETECITDPIPEGTPHTQAFCHTGVPAAAFAK